MDVLIAYWQAKLDRTRWLMSDEDRAMVQHTIKALRELKKQRSTSKVERDAEIVRTVKQLAEVKS